MNEEQQNAASPHARPYQRGSWAALHAMRPGPLNQALAEVVSFRKAFGLPVSHRPEQLTGDDHLLHIGLLQEEIAEIAEAARNNNLAGLADGIVDLIYFALGYSLHAGLPLSAVFDAVHAANMSKLQPNGTVKRDAGGKVVKPEGWHAPDVEAIVTRASQ